MLFSYYGWALQLPDWKPPWTVPSAPITVNSNPLPLGAQYPVSWLFRMATVLPAPPATIVGKKVAVQVVTGQLQVKVYTKLHSPPGIVPVVGLLMTKLMNSWLVLSRNSQRTQGASESDSIISQKLCHWKLLIFRELEKYPVL